MKKVEDVFDQRFWKIVTLFGVAVIIISATLPIILTAGAMNERFNFTKTGEIGDTIGGTTAPFVAIIAALLTFLAFWVQYKANLKQTEQFDKQAQQFEKQAQDVSIERFENKFYEAIRLHKENVNEFEIYNSTKDNYVKGRKVFIHMFFEYRFCYALIKKYLENIDNKDSGFDKTDEVTISNIAYHIFFMGIGKNSDKLIIKSLAGICHQEFITNLLIYLSDFQKKKRNAKDNYKFKVKLKENPNELVYVATYVPFSGHMSRLGHYFRHLYQTVKLISEQEESIINRDEKQYYAKTLRAQLSDYEQLLLFYNVNSYLGSAWLDGQKNFIKEYRMIKNMPLPLADFGIIPEEIFKEEISYWNEKGKSFFEWDERQINK